MTPVDFNAQINAIVADSDERKADAGRQRSDYVTRYIYNEGSGQQAANGLKQAERIAAAQYEQAVAAIDHFATSQIAAVRRQWIADAVAAGDTDHVARTKIGLA